VIIGNGGAGTSALRTLREVDKVSDITIISREKYPAYSPCSLPNLLSGEIDRPKIFRFDEGFYSQLNARFLKNTEALSILPRKKMIGLTNGVRVKYDKLLISTGAKPITPPGMEGLELDGVHVMGTLDSAIGILDQIKQGIHRAVVIGGGFMGIETGSMLRKSGVEVTIVELLPRILSRMLDPDVSKKVEGIIEEHGVTVVLDKAVTCVKGNKRGGGVESVLIGESAVKCDMVVLAIGVVPNLDIVKGSGIRANRGIIVDQTMRTNLENIYAAGDIAEVREQIEGRLGSYAIWPNAVEQGRVAALNMAGIHTIYEGAEVVNVLDVFGTPVIAMGGTSETIDGCVGMVRATPGAYRKLLLKDNRIMGLQFVGDVKNSGPLYSFMKKGTDVGTMKDRLLYDNFVHFPDAAPAR